MNHEAGAPGHSRSALRYFLLTLPLFILPQVVPGSTAVQLGVTALVFCVLTGLFLSQPAAFLSSLFASIAAGGIELDLGATTPKLFFAIIAVTAYAVSVLIRKALGPPPGLRAVNDVAPSTLPRTTVLPVLLLLYLVLLLPSLLQMQVPQRSAYLLVMRALVLGGVIVFAREDRLVPSRAPVLFVISLLGSIIAAGYVVEAIAVYRVTSFAELAAGLALKDNTVQVGILGTTNTIASFLSLTLPLAVAHLLSADRRTWERPFALANVAVQSFGLIATFSRGGAVAVIGAIAVAALLCNTSVRQLRRLLGLVAVAVGVVVMAGILAQDAMRDSFASRFALSSMGEYWIGRLELWYSAWRAFLQSPVFGIGVGNVGFFDRDFGSGHGSETHNLLLQSLAEEGLVAAVLLFAVLSAIVWRNVRAARVGDTTQLWIVVGLLAALINAMIEPTFWQPAFAGLFWFSGLFFYRNASAAVRAARAAAPVRAALPMGGQGLRAVVPVRQQP